MPALHGAVRVCENAWSVVARFTADGLEVNRATTAIAGADDAKLIEFCERWLGLTDVLEQPSDQRSLRRGQRSRINLHDSRSLLLYNARAKL